LQSREKKEPKGLGSADSTVDGVEIHFTGLHSTGLHSSGLHVSEP
jgi:hypothetical protein